MPEQLSLFAPSEEPSPVGPAPPDPKLESIASHIPPEIRLGTSSWAFPGWKGIVYDREASQKTLSHRGLEAYSRNPLFRAVAIDRTYYGPIPASEFRAYAEQVPESFRFLVKAHEALTRPEAGARHRQQQGRGLRAPLRLQARRGDLLLELPGDSVILAVVARAAPEASVLPVEEDGVDGTGGASVEVELVTHA